MARPGPASHSATAPATTTLRFQPLWASTAGHRLRHLTRSQAISSPSSSAGTIPTGWTQQHPAEEQLLVQSGDHSLEGSGLHRRGDLSHRPAQQLEPQGAQDDGQYRHPPPPRRAAHTYPTPRETGPPAHRDCQEEHQEELVLPVEGQVGEEADPGQVEHDDGGEVDPARQGQRAPATGADGPFPASSCPPPDERAEDDADHQQVERAGGHRPADVGHGSRLQHSTPSQPHPATIVTRWMRPARGWSASHALPNTANSTAVTRAVAAE